MFQTFSPTSDPTYTWHRARVLALGGSVCGGGPAPARKKPVLPTLPCCCSPWRFPELSHPLAHLILPKACYVAMIKIYQDSEILLLIQFHMELNILSKSMLLFMRPSGALPMRKKKVLRLLPEYPQPVASNFLERFKLHAIIIVMFES